MSIAKITIIGNVGGEPQIKVFDGGNSVTTFSVAVTSKKDSETDWYRVSAWGKLGEICSQHVGKGRQVYVDGRFSVRYWDKDGVRQTSLEIAANDVQFLGSKTTDADSGVERRPFDQDSVPF